MYVMVGISLIVTVLFGLTFYHQQKAALMAEIDGKLFAVATLARETLPADYHDRITGPESVSDSEFQKIVERNNRLCESLGLEYIWSLMMVDGRIVFTSSTSPDKVAANRKHAKFFEPHSNPELYTQAFERTSPTYQSNIDKWGNLRAVLIPFHDAQGREYLFGASYRLDIINQGTWRIIWQALAVGLMFFVASTTIGSWVIRVLVRPIHQLTETIQKIAAGDHNVSAEEQGTYELATLAHHFNLMHDALQDKISLLKAVRVRMIETHDSERQEAKAELGLSEQRYRALLNFAVDGILVGSHDGIITEANECMCTIFGMPRHEMIGKSIREMPFTPESVSRCPFRYDLLQVGVAVVSERTIRRSDGSEIVVEMHTKMMADGTYQSIYRDITDRKRTEVSLEETRRLLDETQSIAHVGGWQYDAATGKSTWTDEVYRIYGVGRDFDINDPTRGLSFFPPAYARAILQAFTKTLEQGEPYDLEAEFIRADGERLWVRSIGQAVMEDGRVVRVRGSFMDITTRKRAEEKLLASEQRYRDILNFAVDGILVCSHEGIIIEANECLCGFCGLSRAELIGHSIREIPFTPESLLKHPIRVDLVEMGETVVSERTIRHRDGSEVVVEMHTKKMPDGNHQSIWHDITQRKQTEALLIETRRLLDDTQRIARLGGWSVDFATGKAVWTDEVYRIYGIGHDADINDRDYVFSFYAPEYASLIKKNLIEALPTGQSFDVESEFVRANGERIWVRVIGQPILANGEVVKVNGCLMDITDRKLVERSLRDSEDRYRQLFEMESDALFLIDSEFGQILDVNLSAQMLYGYSRDELLSKRNNDLSAEPEQTKQATQKSAKEAPTLLRIALRRHRKRDGSVFTVEIAARSFLMNGRPVHIAAIRDITERERVEQALRESQDRYRQLFEMESDAIFLIDVGTRRFLDFNPAAQELYGYSREELLERGTQDISAEPEVSRIAIQKGVNSGAAFLKVPLIRHRRKDGRVIPVEISGRFFQMNGQRVLLAGVRDISERMKAQELIESWNVALEKKVVERTAEAERRLQQLKRLAGRLIQAEESERQRISDVLHEDLQQTLVAARMTLSIAVEPVKSAIAQASLKRVDAMLSESIRLTRTLVQTMAVPAAKEGELTSAIGWIAQQMKEKFGLNVDLTVGDGLAPVSENVYLCLYRAIQEVLFNVVKHSNVLQAEIEVRAVENHLVQVTVKDRGCGISDIALSEQEKTGGGIGLYNIRERIEGLGGHMQIVSAEAKGTSVVLTVPMHEAAP